MRFHIKSSSYDHYACAMPAICLYYAFTMPTIPVLCLYYAYYACTMPIMPVPCLLCLFITTVKCNAISIFSCSLAPLISHVHSDL